MLVTWNPWNDLGRLERDFFNPAAGAERRREEVPRVANWQPRIDVVEEAERFLLYADLPGLEAADIEISVDKNVLALKGERRDETHEGALLSRRERVFGPFARAFTLPETVDAEHVSADMKNGVLSILLPKRPVAQPQKIAIKAS